MSSSVIPADANPHRVMGIDPGLTRCGLSVVESGRGRAVIPIAVGVIRTPAGDDLTERLLAISDGVNEWMDTYHPSVVAIERVFERGNVSTVMHTAHAVGVLVLAAAQRGLPVTMYTPSEVKKAISGNGRADKKQMTIMITRILGLAEPPKPADAADALALAVCHCWRAPLLQRAKSHAARELGDPDELRRKQQGRLAQLKAEYNRKTRSEGMAIISGAQPRGRVIPPRTERNVK